MPVHEYFPSLTSGVHARQFHLSSPDAQSPSQPARTVYRYRSSSHSSASMAPCLSRRLPKIVTNSNTGASSLYSYSDATPTETSVSTSLASDLCRVPLLEEKGGVLQRPPTEMQRPIFVCSFWFLDCSYISRDQEEWKTHCMSHFRGEDPPETVDCPLCEDFAYTGDNGWTSWDHRQEHVAMHHILGRTLRTSRPDFHLFRHLWSKRLISDQDLKDLMSGNHSLARPPSNFVTRRDGRQQRHQHISARRAHDSNRRQRNVAGQNSVPTTQEREHQTPGNFASMRIVEARAHRPETSTNTTDPRCSNTEETKAASQISPTQPPREEIHDTSRIDQGNALNVPRRGETQTETSLPCPSETLKYGINDIVDTHLHSGTISKVDDGSYESDSESLPCDSDLSEETELSEPTLGDQILGIDSHILKEEYFELLMHSFNSTRQRPPIDVVAIRQRPQNSGTASKGKHRASAPSTTDSSQQRSSKRSRRRSPDEGDQDDQVEGDGRRNAPGGAPPGQEDHDPAEDALFACPFVKRYPHRYLKCFSHSLKDISRVKQHLFRDKTHRLPIYCPRCSETFEGEDVRDEHIRDAQCDRRTPVKWDGITESQRRQLSKRLPSTRPPEENWFCIFRILFPGEPLPSSPYIDMGLSGELRAFREHLLIEGPRIWNEFLTSQLPEHLRPYLEELQSLHDSFYEESIVRLCESWYSQCSPNTSLDTRRTLEDETIPHAVPALIPSPVAAPFLRNCSTIESADVHSKSYLPRAVCGSHPTIEPSSTIPQGIHTLPAYQSILDIPPTPDYSAATNPPRISEALPHPDSIVNAVGQSHIGAPHLQCGTLEKNVQDTLHVLDATFQSADPSHRDPPLLLSSLAAQNQSYPQDVFDFLDIDRF